ncbi:cytochrome P450 [Mycena rebaudengoi]|nr:cytochrome P450 [Mycena rebaudengoi]
MALVLAVALLLGGVCIVSLFRRRSSIKDIPGPPSTSWVYGNLLDLLLPHSYGDHEFEWQRRYGAVYRIKGCFGSDHLVVSDPLSIQYVLKGTVFQRGPMMDNLVDILYHEDSAVAQRDHQRARAALNPAFTASAVREFLPVFERTAEMLTTLLEESLAANTPTDICPVVGTATLSAIGEGISAIVSAICDLFHPEAMFGCTLQDMGEELVTNHHHLILMAGGYTRAHVIGTALIPYIPRTLLRLARHAPLRASRVVLKAQTLTQKLGTQLVNERLDALQHGLELNKDVFGSLLDPRAAGKSKYVMTRREVAAQTSLLLLAGQDTSANVLSFGLRNAEDVPNPPVKKITEIPIRKSQIIMLATASYQRLESLWGSDADEWKPSRWIEGTTYKGDAVGPYSNLLSFFGGPRVCLGWRFALLEMQVLTCELVGKFLFRAAGGPRCSPALRSHADADWTQWREELSPVCYPHFMKYLG